MNVHFAILDIGSNSIRYMAVKRGVESLRVGDEKQSTMQMAIELPETGRGTAGLHISDKKRSTTRLATGLLETGRLCAANMLSSAASIHGFCAEAEKEGLTVYAYATSAVRDAENRGEFLALLDGIPNLCLEILSGEDEAKMAYIGATAGRQGTLIDIGGGSLQIATPGSAASAPFGCVRAKEFCEVHDLALAKQALSARLFTLIDIPKTHSAPYLGVGGSITTLGALLAGQTVFAGGAKLGTITQENLKTLLTALYKMGAERAAHPLLATRHDTILHGGLLLACLMDALCIQELTPSHADGMEGYALSLSKSYCGAASRLG